MSSGNG